MAILAVLAAEDFSKRLISWYWIPMLFVLFAGRALSQLSMGDAVSFFVINLCILALQLLLVSAYFSIRERRVVNIIDTWLGTGDILFFVVLCAAFSPLNYLLFYLLSLVLTIAGYIVYKIMKGRSSAIPLAGAVALLLLLCLLLHWYEPRLDFYNDAFVMQLLFAH
jgi:hypothetical protein